MINDHFCQILIDTINNLNPEYSLEFYTPDGKDYQAVSFYKTKDGKNSGFVITYTKVAGLDYKDLLYILETLAKNAL